MITRLLVLLASLAPLLPVEGQSAEPVKATLNWRSDLALAHDYLVFLPKGYEESKRDWPMLVWLHGGGGTAKSVPRRLQVLADEPYLILAPICPPLPKGVEGKYQNWRPEPLGAIVRKVVADYRVDEGKVALAGFSMGGSGAWELPFWHPKLFHKVMVISGSCHPWKLKHYPKIPVRVFSGEAEEWLPQHTNSVRSAKQFGVDVEHTIWPGAGHGACCSRTLRHEPLRRWLRGDSE